MKAKIRTDFKTLFFYGSEIEGDGYLQVDEDCVHEFETGTEVEILKTFEVGEYAPKQKAYVIFDPKSKECITIAAIFVEIIEEENECQS